MCRISDVSPGANVGIGRYRKTFSTVSEERIVMIFQQSVIQQDMDRIIQFEQLPWKQLANKKVFITGATGLIGKYLVYALLHRNDVCGDGITVIALVRNVERAKKILGATPRADLQFVEGSLEQLPEVASEIDYVIHCACPTESRYFVEQPVDTIQTIFSGTRNMLELAREKQVASMVFLSSMEVYGQITRECELSEDILGDISLSSPRSCYPMAKRLAENLCCCYWAQHGVPAKICRLAQTFGPGVKAEDNRVFAYMARCVQNKQDIELATDGSKKNMYLYTADAVTAILMILLSGQPATAYNAANAATYCSVKQMGNALSEHFAQGKVAVKTNTSPQAQSKYPPTSYLKLDTARLEQLGWKASTDLMEMYERMMLAF